MAKYSVGPGVLDAMNAAGDVPRSDEQYTTPNVSVTYGRDAVYYYMKEDNRVNRLPFDGA